MEEFSGKLQKFVHYFPAKKIEGNLEFITGKELPLQIGIHEPKEDRTSRIHFHKFFVEFFYVEKGHIDITFTDNKFENPITKRINEGDSFVMYPGIGHTVFFPAGCRVIEVHPGPYMEDKEFPNV